MRRGLVPLVALVLLVTGCHGEWGSYSSGSGSATYYGDAEASVRSAIPAIEAYNADHGSYAGMTVDSLRAEYDAGIGDVRIVVAKKASYCVESTVEGATYSYRGPGGPTAAGGCSDAPTQVVEPPPPASYDARTNLQIAIPAIEAWRLDHGTYAGMTLEMLRAKYDYGIPLEVEVVDAEKNEYCIESSARGETWSYHGPKRGLASGAC